MGAVGWFRRRPWIIASSVLAVLGVCGFVGIARMSAVSRVVTRAGGGSHSTVAVTLARVERLVVPSSLMVTGSLVARDELPIGTETSQLALAAVLVDVGDHVKRGQLLARFNDQVLQAQQRQASAALSEARANAAESGANARRADELRKTGSISAQEFDSRHSAELTMKARVEVAEANLALADARLKQAEIRAPSDGTITSRSAHIGAVPFAGNGEMFRMIRDDCVELVAEVPESDLARVRVGQAVAVEVDGGGEHDGSVAGSVRLVEPTVDSKTRIGRVHITVARHADLVAGVFVVGRIQLGNAETLMVPEKAVVYQEGRPVVFVIDAAAKAARRTVTVGVRDRGRISILSGLDAGERVVVVGAGYLTTGDLVSVASGLPTDIASESMTRAN